MTLTAARANAGLSATATATSTGVTGSVEIGTFNNFVTLTDCDVAYALRARIVSGSNLVLVVATNTTSASDAYTSGTAQVETATVTAASGATSSGNLTVTVTAAGMTGSPKAILVPLTTAVHTTATLIATAIKDALNADTAYAALFTATSSTNTVITTRNASTLGFFPANDSTLNIAIAAGLGVSAAATSTNTTAGVASSGANISDGDAKDFEGITIPTIVTLKGFWARCASGAVTMTSSNEDAKLRAGEYRVATNDTNNLSDLLTTLTFNATSDSDIYITVVGKTT